MKADILTLKALFQKDVRYVIPTFQRPYVWNQEDQWEPLWNDVRNIAEQYLEELAMVGEDKQTLAEERAGMHFLGAVVLQQQPTSTAQLEARHVIDGQQRLTTLQLLLDAAQEVLEKDEHPKEARILRKLVLNDDDFAEEDPDNVYKLWPTLVDREPFRRAMANDLVASEFETAPIVQAHEFFQLQIRQWLMAHPEMAGRRAAGLMTALVGLLQMVVIDLQPSDDANVIFETLNARGTPLLASDLIKNSILHTAGEEGLNGDALYGQYWQRFDETWWRSEIRQGRLVRPRIDVYLNHWLVMRTAEEVQSSDVFTRFRKYAKEPGLAIKSIVADVAATSETFRKLETLGDSTIEGMFLYRWHVMDAGVVTPVVLWLFANRDAMGADSLYRSLQAIESYLLRRMVCRLTTKDYNRLFLDLMGVLKKSDATSAADAVVSHLASQTSESRACPSDNAIREAFVSLPLYQLLTRGRLRLLLEGIEDSLRSPKSEDAHVARGLTIEHIMPQGWREHWPLEIQEPAGAAASRDRLVQTIGNLTLVTKQLNPSLSNSPWVADAGKNSKRAGLSEHTVLHLNKRVLDSTPDAWTEDQIRARSNTLADLAARAWPAPGAT